jgi:hypothetical protein
MNAVFTQSGASEGSDFVLMFVAPLQSDSSPSAQNDIGMKRRVPDLYSGLQAENLPELAGVVVEMQVDFLRYRF